MPKGSYLLYHGEQPGIEFINAESTSSHEQYSIDIYNTKNYKAVNTYVWTSLLIPCNVSVNSKQEIA